MIEARMGLAAGLAEATLREVAEVVGEGDPHAQGEHGGAHRAGVALGLRKEAARNATPAEVREHREAAEVEGLAPARRQHAAHQPAAGLRDDDGVIGGGGGDGLRGVAECARVGLEPATVLLEGRVDELGDRRTLRARGAADRDLARGSAQTVCSGRWSSATKLLNFVVSPSKRSITLLIGPWRCFATMISAFP